MAEIQIWGYADRLSVRPGDTIRFMVSAEATDRVQAELVRLVHGDANPEGPGFVEQPVASPLAREWAVRRQYVQSGNFLRVNDPAGVLALGAAFTLHAYIFPTLP